MRSKVIFVQLKWPPAPAQHFVNYLKKISFVNAIKRDFLK